MRRWAHLSRHRPHPYHLPHYPAEHSYSLTGNHPRVFVRHSWNRPHRHHHGSVRGGQNGSRPHQHRHHHGSVRGGPNGNRHHTIYVSRPFLRSQIPRPPHSIPDPHNQQGYSIQHMPGPSISQLPSNSPFLQQQSNGLTHQPGNIYHLSQRLDHPPNQTTNISHQLTHLPNWQASISHQQAGVTQWFPHLHHQLPHNPHQPTNLGHHQANITHQPTNLSHHQANITHQPTNLSHHQANITHQPTNLSHHQANITHQPTNLSDHEAHIPHQQAGLHLHSLHQFAEPLHQEACIPQANLPHQEYHTIQELGHISNQPGYVSDHIYHERSQPHSHQQPCQRTSQHTHHTHQCIQQHSHELSRQGYNEHTHQRYQQHSHELSSQRSAAHDHQRYQQHSQERYSQRFAAHTHQRYQQHSQERYSQRSEAHTHQRYQQHSQEHSRQRSDAHTDQRSHELPRLQPTHVTDESDHNSMQGQTPGYQQTTSTHSSNTSSMRRTHPEQPGAGRPVSQEQGAARDQSEDMTSMVEPLRNSRTQGLSGACIRYLPSHRFRADIQTSEQIQCVVCLNEYEDGQLIRGLPCSHEFHAICIDKWLKAKRTCPICRADASQWTSE